MMNKLLTLVTLMIMISAKFADAQDIIVMRENEKEIKCRITEVSDSLIYYRVWRSESDSVYEIRKSEVLSYAVNKNQNLKKSKEKKVPNENILEHYRSGETRPGYLILTNGDTLASRLNIRNVAANQLEVVALQESGEVASFDPGSLLGYGYDLLHYEAVNIDFKGEITAGKKCTGRLYLERLVSGPARLYRLSRLIFPKPVMDALADPPLYYGELYVDYYVIPPEGKPRLLKNNSPRNNLIRLFEDHKALVEDMIENKPSKSDVPDIVRNYNYWYENLKSK